MSLTGFFATIHLERFSDLALLVGDHQVDVVPLSVGSDGTVRVFIRGEDSEFVCRLDGCVQRIDHILSVAPIIDHWGGVQ